MSDLYRRRKVHARINAILDADPAYVSYDQIRDPSDRRRVRSIVVTRSRGALRQKRLRAEQLHTSPPEELSAYPISVRPATPVAAPTSSVRAG